MPTTIRPHLAAYPADERELWRGAVTTAEPDPTGAGAAVEEFPGDFELTRVAPRLLDHVRHDLANAGRVVSVLVSVASPWSRSQGKPELHLIRALAVPAVVRGHISDGTNTDADRIRIGRDPTLTPRAAEFLTQPPRDPSELRHGLPIRPSGRANPNTRHRPRGAAPTVGA